MTLKRKNIYIGKCKNRESDEAERIQVNHFKWSMYKVLSKLLGKLIEADDEKSNFIFAICFLRRSSNGGWISDSKWTCGWH